MVCTLSRSSANSPLSRDPTAASSSLSPSLTDDRDSLREAQKEMAYLKGVRGRGAIEVCIYISIHTHTKTKIEPYQYPIPILIPIPIHTYCTTSGLDMRSQVSCSNCTSGRTFAYNWGLSSWKDIEALRKSEAVLPGPA